MRQRKVTTRMREPKSRTRQRVARMQSARKFKVVLTTADYNPSPAKVFSSLVPFLEHFRKKGFLLAGETESCQKMSKMPKVSKRCKKMPKIAKKCPKLPEVAIRCKMLQKDDKCCQKCQKLSKDGKN